MTKPERVLFLYTELAEYFMACIEELSKPGIEIHIIRWPLNREAPFEFRNIPNTNIYDRSDYNTAELELLAASIDPDIVCCSGWVDKGYLSVCKSLKDHCPRVLLLDNQWIGSWKQKLAGLSSGIFIKPYFDKAWVPGQPQATFAEKLGFKEIREGFYCADTARFEDYNERFRESKRTAYPKRLLFLGRYLEFKGIFDLWESFSELVDNKFPEWTLYCLGTGELWDQRMIHDSIKHFGFVQPSEMDQYIRETSIFVLPSHKEPWGVVVHEMAAAGYPMICSDTIGAASSFLDEGKNGFTFKAADKADLKSKLARMMSISQSEYNSMADRSHELSKEVSPERWVQTLMELC